MELTATASHVKSNTTCIYMYVHVNVFSHTLHINSDEIHSLWRILTNYACMYIQGKACDLLRINKMNMSNILTNYIVYEKREGRNGNLLQ